MKTPRVLVLGGAGFIGSRIALAGHGAGTQVTVLDGLLPRTGGRRENLAHLPGVRFIEQRIEDAAQLPALLSEHDLVVDAMAWTCHRLALHDPAYDLDLNLRSHLHWLAQVPTAWPGRIIFLASRGQYGSPAGISEITEDTPQAPEDVQGIHKTAAESHFRLFSRLHRVPVVSLRMPAIVGPNQPTMGEDIGLFGGFIRDLLAGHAVELYGEGRRRAVLHVDDVAETILQLAGKEWNGFTPFNLAGHNVLLADALHALVAEIGHGKITILPAPAEIVAIDIGGLSVSENRITTLLGSLPRRSLQDTLRAAVEHFKNSCPNP